MIKNPKISLVWTLYKPIVNQKILPSLSIAYLAKFLEQNGFCVDCIDCNLLVYDKWKYQKIDYGNMGKILFDLVLETEKTKPDILGIGFWTEGISFVREFVKLIKERNPGLKIIIGGPTASFLPGKVLNFIPEADCVVRGEGELTLLEIAEKFSAKKSFEKIFGLSYRSKSGLIVDNPDRPLINNLNRLPLVDFDNFVYIGSLDGLHIVTSRGCPHNCYYCSASNFYDQYRYYSPRYVKRQIVHLIKRYNARYIALADDNVMANPIRAFRLFELLAASNLHCEFPSSARIDSLSADLMGMLKKAKVTWLTVGLENIVPKVLSYYKRTPNPKKYLVSVDKGIMLLEKYKIGAAFAFVLGAPVETENDMLKNLAFMEKLAEKNILIYASLLRAVPGSYFWQRYEKGEMELIRLGNTGTGFPFDDKYMDIEWICPNNFAFRHEIYPDKEFIKIRNKIAKKLSGLTMKNKL